MRNFYLLLFSILFFFTNCDSPLNDVPERINTYKGLEANFQNPPVDYLTMPFIVWNGTVTKEKIDRQLNEIKDAGYGGGFIHPRWGLVNEYINDEWYELTKYTVDKAKKLGLQIWLYDEDAFPSGFAGGHVQAQMPESYNKGQGLLFHKMEKLELDSEKEYLLIFEKDNDNLINITDNYIDKIGIDGEFLAYELSYYHAARNYGGFPYVDLIYPGVTEKFIEVTMPGYERTLQNDFGGAVPGIFTDEPNIQPPTRHAIRYTPDLFEVFEQTWGYDLAPNLQSLFEEVGDYKKVRHNYYQTLLQLFIDRWSKPWYEYTEEKNLKWTGHYWEHGWPNPQHGGDNMAMYAWHQVPAIDMLFNNESERPDQFGNVRNVKELSSVANQMGRQRTLSETYGGAGWEIRFQDLKRLGDWEYVMGVNLMNQHLVYMDIMGDRKHDFPQSFSKHNSWWKHYKKLNDYFGRLSLAMSSGEQINKILIIEPTTTAWMYYSPTSRNEQMNKIGNAFEDFLVELEKNQIEYDLGCENIIKDHGSITGDKFVINKRSYDLVIIPPITENLDKNTAELLSEYAKNNGNIVVIGETPTLVDGEESPIFRELENEANFTYAASLDELDMSLLKDENFQFINPKEIKGILLHHRRMFKDGQLVFLSNFSKEKTSSGSFLVNGKKVALLDANTGKIYSYPSEKQNDLLKIEFKIQPHNSMLFFVGDKVPELKEFKNIVPTNTVFEGTPTQISRNADNVLMIDYCDLEIDGKTEKDLLFYNAAKKAFQHYGFEENPWSVSVQYKSTFVEKDTFPSSTGVKSHFTFVIDELFDVSNPMKLVAERPDIWQVSINGEQLQPIADEHWLDHEFGVFDISGKIKTGANKVTIDASPMSVFAEIEPVYILGDFGLASIEHGWEITKATEKMDFTPWCEQHMPFYADAVTYTKEIELSESQDISVKLNDWFGTTAAVKVNGKEAGIIGWEPYELEISEYLTTGKNTVAVEVYGSLKNVLGPHHNVTRRGIVTPWSWRYSPEPQPAGELYDVLDYGLFEDFELVTN